MVVGFHSLLIVLTTNHVRRSLNLSRLRNILEVSLFGLLAVFVFLVFLGGILEHFGDCIMSILNRAFVAAVLVHEHVRYKTQAILFIRIVSPLQSNFIIGLLTKSALLFGADFYLLFVTFSDFDAQLLQLLDFWYKAFGFHVFEEAGEVLGVFVEGCCRFGDEDLLAQPG